MTATQTSVAIDVDQAPLLQTPDLTGQVAVVTGSSSGIGHRCARVLDKLGATVVLVARREERLRELAGSLHDASWVVSDLADANQAMALIPNVLDRYGRVDVVVNNAGGLLAPGATALEETRESMVSTLELNLVTPFLISQAAASHMRIRKSGRIIMVASAAAIRQTPSVPLTSYVAAKAGLIGLTRELAVQWVSDGIRINVIAPGMFHTDATPTYTDPEVVARQAATIPMGRIGRGSDIDGLLAFLATDASDYITGHVFPVDGGYTLV